MLVGYALVSTTSHCCRRVRLHDQAVALLASASPMKQSLARAIMAERVGATRVLPIRSA